LEDRFPMTARYYRALFSERLCFTEVARFNPLFRVFGIGLDDSSAQETWRVYDRPGVHLFARQACLSAKHVRDVLAGPLPPLDGPS
jgi:hypothetical protein